MIKTDLLEQAKKYIRENKQPKLGSPICNAYVSLRHIVNRRRKKYKQLERCYELYTMGLSREEIRKKIGVSKGCMQGYVNCIEKGEILELYNGGHSLKVNEFIDWKIPRVRIE